MIDNEKREEALKKMTELLLSRATMLKYHCPDCKLPLFEKDGKIICVNCGEFMLSEEEIVQDEEKFREGVEKKEEAFHRLDDKIRILNEVLDKKLLELIERLKFESSAREIIVILDAIKKIIEMRYKNELQ